MKVNPMIAASLFFVLLSAICTVPAQAESGISVDPLSPVFPNVTPGCTQSMAVTIASTGTSILNISDIEFVYNDFNAFSFEPLYLPLALSPGETVDLIISFSPSVDTMMVAALEISSDAGDVWINLLGDGYGTDPCAAPDIEVSPRSHDFGTLEPGSSSTLEISIANPGTEALAVSGMSFRGAASVFALDAESGSNPCGDTEPILAPGERCSVAVTFEAPDAGSYLAYLDIASNDPDEAVVEVTLIASALTRKPVSLSLHIEDALEGIPVNKLVGDFSGPSDHTWISIVVKLISLNPESTEDIPVVLTVPGDLFGRPRFTSTRDTEGGYSTPISCEGLGAGRYRVVTDLYPTSVSPPAYRKQIVWSFQVPNGTAPQNVAVTAEVDMPGSDSAKRATIRFLAPGSVDSLIIANRMLLYAKYDEREVTALLQRLFTEAQGAPASHSPRGVVYYVERYSPLASNWDNTAVDYTNEFTANETAAAIDDLIEDWADDASLIVPVEDLPGWTMPVALPSYLLVVGNDDAIPFYRFEDPVNYLTEAQWEADSSTNPAIRATDENYFFTDNPYADLGGADWRTGDIELSVGRILGDSAADVLSLLREGVNEANGRTGGIVMASVEGLELGLEPDDGRAGEIADLHNVPELFRSRGFDVRNDGDPPTELRTIDVINPYEPGLITEFRNAANDPSGMDLFFIGAHGDYFEAGLPGDPFTPDDTCAGERCSYHRFDDDHPISAMLACHAGIPVPDIDLNGGTDHNLVYDLIHEGARAFIGPTGFGYASTDVWLSREGFGEGNTALHQCVFGEYLLQDFFGKLLSPDDSVEPVSMTIGEALARAKKDYVFGTTIPFPLDVPLDSEAIDRKTVAEFLLYGVPWASISYPDAASIGSERAIPEINQPQKQAFAASGYPIVRLDQGIYAQTIEVNIGSYEVKTFSSGNVEYDHFYVEGGDTAVVPGAPILPYVKSHVLPLPYGGAITHVNIIEIESDNIGTYHLPIAEVLPLSRGGINYTPVTEIDYAYPKETHLVQYQQTGEGILFTVFPVQHDPSTGQTVFHSRFKIQIIYESPLTVTVAEFRTGKRRYVPGEEINTIARIVNVGDENAELTAALDIKDALGQVVGQMTSALFSVPSGDSYVLSMNFPGTLDDGAYTVQSTLLNGGKAIGGAAAVISVIGSGIADLSLPAALMPDETGIFELSLFNNTSDPFSGEVFLTIQHSQGGTVKELAPQLVNLEPGANGEAVFSWSPLEVSGGTYVAIAGMAADGRIYGSITKPFTVISIEVGIDVKPGACPNPLNVHSKGVLPVAILGAQDFEVDRIDPQSILLEGVSPLLSSIEDVGTPDAGNQDFCSCGTPSADGFNDLVLKFDVQEIAGTLDAAEEGDFRVLTLTGTLLESPDDSTIGARDCVQIMMK